MALLLPKHVKICNFRLMLLYYSWVAGILALCILNFMSVRGGTRRLANAPQVEIRFNMQQTFKKVAEYDRTDDPVCSLPDGWSSRDVSDARMPLIDHVYERFQCSFLDMDGSQELDSDGLDISEAGRLHSPFEIDLFVKDQYVHVGQNVSLTGLNSMPSRSHAAVDTKFHTFAQAYVYNFSYKFALQEKAHRFFNLNNNLIRMGNQRDAKTVVLDAGGMPALTFEPGLDIEMNAPQALKLAQGSRPSASTLRLGDFDGDNGRFPTWAWETGAMLKAVVNCFSDDYDIRETAGEAAGNEKSSVWDLGASSERPVCIMQLTLVASELVDTALELKKPGSIQRLHRTVLRMVGGQGNSYFRAYDFNAVLFYFTSSLVLLALPRNMIYWFALNCLGHLSVIYRHVVVQEFGVRYACARAVMQFVSHSVCFYGLADCRQGPGGSGETGMSQKRLKDCLKGVVLHREDQLDEQEVSVLSDFAYRQILKAQEQSKKRGGSLSIDLGDIGNFEIGNGEIESDMLGTDKIVDIDGFCQATGSEIIGLDTLVKLFDADRAVWPGERLFTPNDIWQNVHKQRRQQLSISSCLFFRIFRSFATRMFRGASSTEASRSSKPETATVQTIGESAQKPPLPRGFSNHLREMALFGEEAAEPPVQSILKWQDSEEDQTTESVRANSVRAQCVHGHAGMMSVERIERTLDDLCKCVQVLQTDLEKEKSLRYANEKVLQTDLEKEKNLRYANEKALREEMQRALKACSEQTALRTDLALASNGKKSSDHHHHYHYGDFHYGLQPEPTDTTDTSLDVAGLREDVLRVITQHSASLRQEVLEAITQQEASFRKEVLQAAFQQDSRLEALARQEAESQILLHMQSADQVKQPDSVTTHTMQVATHTMQVGSPGLSKSVRSTSPTDIAPLDQSSNKVGNNGAVRLDRNESATTLKVGNKVTVSLDRNESATTVKVGNNGTVRLDRNESETTVNGERMGFADSAVQRRCEGPQAGCGIVVVT